MAPHTFSPEALAAIAGAILSLVMSYIPGVSDLYARLGTTPKQLLMAILLAVAAFGTVLWSCSGANEGFGMCFGGTDWKAVVTGFVFAIMANQATHRLTPKSE